MCSKNGRFYVITYSVLNKICIPFGQVCEQFFNYPYSEIPESSKSLAERII
jgi:hypothetical protein